MFYHYAGNNPVKYTDPDGRESSFKFPTWVKAEDKCINTKYSMNQRATYSGISCLTTYTKSIDHYRTSFTGFFLGNEISFSGTKDVISINTQSGISGYKQDCTLIRLNVNYNGKSFDFFSISINTSERFLIFPLKSSSSKADILKEDPFNDSNSIYSGQFYRKNVEDGLDLNAMLDIYTFGLSNFLEVPGGQATSFLFNYCLDNLNDNFQIQYENDGDEQIIRDIKYILQEN